MEKRQSDLKLSDGFFDFCHEGIASRRYLGKGTAINLTIFDLPRLSVERVKADVSGQTVEIRRLAKAELSASKIVALLSKTAPQDLQRACRELHERRRAVERTEERER